MKTKFISVLTATSIVFVGLATVPTLGNSSTGIKNVTVVYGDETIGDYQTEKNTIDEFLSENDYELTEDEIVVYDDVNNITDNTTLYIEKEIDVDVYIDGKLREVTAFKGETVQDLIKELTLSDGIDYYYIDGTNSDKLVDGMSLELLSRSDETFVTTVAVPFETVYQDTEDLPEGTEEVVTEGIDGESVITEKVVFYGGEEYLRKTIGEEVTVEPVNKVIRRGVPKTVSTSQGKLQYSNVLTMSASAYTAGAESTGKNPGDAGYGKTATGATAQQGVVAVDPSVIPLGTKLYIPGYGICTAADTGGSIKGNKIDLCFNTLSEALNFGRRSVDVYVLK